MYQINDLYCSTRGFKHFTSRSFIETLYNQNHLRGVATINGVSMKVDDFLCVARTWHLACPKWFLVFFSFDSHWKKSNSQKWKFSLIWNKRRWRVESERNFLNDFSLVFICLDSLPLKDTLLLLKLILQSYIEWMKSLLFTLLALMKCSGISLSNPTWHDFTRLR